MTYGARAIEIADAVVLVIRDELWSFDRAAVVREYLPDADARTLTSPRCGVYVLDATDQGPFDRSTRLAEYTIGVVVADRWSDPGDPPGEWADGLVELVGAIRARLGDKAESPVLPGEAANGLWVAHPLPAARHYDPSVLREDKVFFSEFAITYRELVTT